MTTNEMLAVMDREAALLEADNWHASAAIMREAAEVVRRRATLAAHARRFADLWSCGATVADWVHPSPDLRAAANALAAAVSAERK